MFSFSTLHPEILILGRIAEQLICSLRTYSWLFHCVWRGHEFPDSLGLALDKTPHPNRLPEGNDESLLLRVHPWRVPPLRRKRHTGSCHREPPRFWAAWRSPTVTKETASLMLAVTKRVISRPRPPLATSAAAQSPTMAGESASLRYQ